MRKNAGFTMTELLAAFMIVALLALFLATGVPAALRLHESITTRAEASTLCATLSSAISGELRFAEAIGEEDGEIVFDSPVYGAGVRVTSPDGRVCVGGALLLGEKVYTHDLRAYAAVGHDGEVFQVTLSVVGPWGEETAHEWAQAQFSVRPLNE